MKDTILIVDDAEINREMLKEMSISAILLDIMMPVMDGFEFMTKLHDMKLMDKIQVLVISGDNTVQNEKKCFDYGVSDFIGRPFNSVLVKRRIQNMVSHFTYKNKLEEKVEEQTAERLRSLSAF